MRFIRRNDSTQLPVNCLFVDTETVDNKVSGDDKKEFHRLEFGVAIFARFDGGRFTRRTDHYFTTQRNYWEIVQKYISNRHRLWIFSHNAGFDATICGMWDVVDKGMVRLTYLVSESPPTIIRFYAPHGTGVWLDTLNWFRMPLHELGESLGIPKLAFPTAECSLAYKCSYCTRDCEIIMTAMEKLFQFHLAHDLGVFKFTIGGQAMQSFRHRFMPTQHVIKTRETENGGISRTTAEVCLIEPHENPIAKELEKDAYHQGFSWCYYIGDVVPAEDFMTRTERLRRDEKVTWRDGPIYALDVNGLYPFVMRDNLFPYRLMGIVRNPKEFQLRDLMKRYCVIANVLIDTKLDAYYARVDKNIRLAKGYFWTSLCSPELERALNDSIIIECSGCTCYERALLFDKHVRFFDDLRIKFRSERNEMFAALCKLLLVSLYGKFGQHQGQWIDVPNVQPMIRWGKYTQTDKETGKIITYRGIGDLLQRQSDYEDLEHTFTAIPAFVTSYGREYMRKLYDIAGEAGLFYSNVDSIHCDRLAKENLEIAGYLDPLALGKLKLVGTYQSGHYHNIRDYVLDGQETIAGVNLQGKKIKDGVYEVLDFERLDSILDCPIRDFVTIRKILKNLDRSYTAGTVSKDGSTDYDVLQSFQTQPLLAFSNVEVS